MSPRSSLEAALLATNTNLFEQIFKSSEEMKAFALAVCIYLLQVALASEADVLEALQNQETLPENANLTDEQLVQYLKTHQTLYNVTEKPVDHIYEEVAMHLTPDQQNRVRRSYIRRTRPINHRLFPIRPTGKDNFSDIPERFDARERWPNCPSLFQIVDQAGCGSCWALSTASAISDRLCINTNGALTVNISAEDLLTCCKTCGASDGCLGGWPIRGFRFFASDGLVTGGPFGDKNSCRPYEVPPRGWRKPKDYYHFSLSLVNGVRSCVKKCQPGYNKTYEEDKYYGRSGYYLPSSHRAIQREIMKHGPVVAIITIYGDFLHYKSGIYRRIAGKAYGGHAVKIIGWGSEHGVPYWIIANTWGTGWGEKGYFRMIRGINDCHVEMLVAAGDVGDGRRQHPRRMPE